ncbi:MAG: exodeoxyribonuclease V subunit gamma [Anaerolineaceae bacterium]|nr:exodeoxyribonuclease V subunit gamma [Anaerolineaceae bacterium]
MTVKLLLSQPAGGKTSFCIEEICRVRMKDPMASVKVIVADKMQMAYWKQTLSQKSWISGRGSGFIGTEIISFSKLAMEILNKAAGSPRLIPSRLDKLCIRESIGNALEKQPFRYFGPISGKPGLLSVFEKCIRILQHGCITPEKLEQTAENDPKVFDTAQVYREYLGILKDNNWIGSAGLLSAAADHLHRDPSVFPECPLLVVDGFDELTQDCVDLLGELSQLCGEILITLPANPGSDNPTDQRILKNAGKIRSELNAEWITPENVIQNSEILYMADRVFYPAAGSAPSGDKKITLSKDSFLMIEASSRTTEVREALRILKERIKTEKLLPSDCAVFVPDMNAYAPILRQFGREMEIPLRFSQKQALSESPAASALKRLLHLAPDFETLKVLSVLRLPFFSGCPDPEDPFGGSYTADLFVIDQIGRKMNIISGTSEWDFAFSKAMEKSPNDLKPESEDSEDPADPDEGKVYEYPVKSKMERIKNSFQTFTALLIPPEGKKPRSEWIKWLEKLLETLRFYEHVEDRAGYSFETDLKSLLRRIVFCEDKLSPGPVMYAEFLGELESEMDDTAQTEREYAGDRIFVGDISASSGCRWKLVILTGFAEGIFPHAEHEDLVLTDALRDALELPHDMDQQLLFHHAVTRSESRLIITRPEKTDKGEEWPASIYWLTIRGLLEKNANLQEASESTRVIPASMDEFAFRLARGSGPESGNVPETISGKLREMLDSAAAELSLMKEQEKGIYSPEKDRPGLLAAVSDPGKDAKPYSCSVIETWLTCPFKYFLMKKLDLEQQKEPGTGLDASQIGTLNHTVMEKTFPPGTVFDSKEEALERADKNFDLVFENAPDTFCFKESELWQYEKKKYREKLLESIGKMFDSPKNMPVNSQWMSVGTELKFGYPKEGKENAEPLTVETEAGPIRIRGIIDRVDRKNDGQMRVVDYKTGLSGFKKEALDAGAHIQAGVYAAAVVHALHMGTRCDGLYWGINDRSVKGYITYNSEKDEKIPNIEFLNKFAAGIRDGAFPAEPAGGDCPDYCPAAPWCRKFVRRQKYG